MMKRNNNTRTSTAFILTIIIIIVVGCLSVYAFHAGGGGRGQGNFSNNTSAIVENINTNANTISNVENVQANIDNVTSDDTPYAFHEWSSEEAPNGYIVRGNAIVDFDANPGEYHYSDLDDLGRAHTAYAMITKADYDRELSEDREELSSKASNIPGMKGNNAKIPITWSNGKQYSSYFYNRSHLIADSLGGSPDVENLIAGTRFQNVGYDGKGGMAYTEVKARDWLSSHDGFIYYCVTPVYNGNELVARSVYVDILSSDGSIDEHVEIFNVSGDVNGNVSMDYTTGKILTN